MTRNRKRNYSETESSTKTEGKPQKQTRRTLKDSSEYGTAKITFDKEKKRNLETVSEEKEDESGTEKVTRNMLLQLIWTVLNLRWVFIHFCDTVLKKVFLKVSLLRFT